MTSRTFKASCRPTERVGQKPRLRHQGDCQEVTVARGGTDARTVVLVPEIQRGTVVGLTLLHARFADDRLATLAVIDLLTAPVHVLAESWRC